MMLAVVYSPIICCMGQYRLFMLASGDGEYKVNP